MKLIKPSFNIIEQDSGIEGIYKQIERAAKVCYKSEGNITEDSAKPFIDNVLLKRGHLSPLEHGTVYLKVPNEGLLRNFIDNTPSHFNYGWCRTNPVMDGDNNVYITTNYRHIIEHKLEDYLKYLCEPTEHHERRVTVHFVCDRVTGESFLRHRAIDEDHLTVEGEVTREMEKDIDSFARESTRFCNYNKDKFNGQFTVITPSEFYDENITDHFEYWGNDDDWVFRTMCSTIAEQDDDKLAVLDTWYFANLATQWSYNRLIKLGWKPEQARRIIPLDIKSELVMTAFVSDWKHFFELRTPANAHPQARELAIPLREEFVRRGYLK